MIIAVDFDGTLCEDRYPHIGEPKQNVIDEAIKRQQNGDKLILWTCREGYHLDLAIAWCKSHGITFDAINCNLPENIAQWKTNPRKIGADEYWDDKSRRIE